MSVADVLERRARWALVEGDCRDALALLPDRAVAHVIGDPPYSDHVHAKHMVGAALPDTAEHRCRFRRKKELGFEAIDAETIQAVAAQAARIATRWSLIFCNVELANDWRAAFEGAGLDYVRTGAWNKIGGTPQFTGDRPAAGFETIVIAHPRGRKKWNGGGKRGVWSVPIEANRLGNRGVRVHTTQKPIDLMLALVADFTDPDDLIVDPFAGSATTGAAALRLGRRFIGIERDATYAALARERLEAEACGSTLAASQRGQVALFGGSR